MVQLPGLSFDLGETITMLRDSVQIFAAHEIAPRVDGRQVTARDLDALVSCGAWISAQLRRENGSRVGRALVAKGIGGTCA